MAPKYFKLLAVLWLLFPVLGLAEPEFPTLTGRVVDNAAILDAAGEASLTAKLEAHEKATSNQLVVVTLPSLQGYDISDFSNRLLRHWQIGQAELNNGALLVVAPNERKVRIEVGYGLEGALTDVISGDIIRRQLLPQFREDDYPTGITRGVDSILSAIEGEYDIDPSTLSGNRDVNQPVKHFPLLFLAIIALFEILKKFGWHKLGNSAFPTAIFGIGATAISNSVFIGLIVSFGVFLVFYFFILPRNANTTRAGTGSSPGRHHDSNRNHSGPGGFGGGGFSGGGGSGGGGGASGGW